MQRVRPRGGAPTALDADRAERLRALVEELALVNASVPVLVEGIRDERALRRLGLSGEVLRLHRGLPLEEALEEIRASYGEVVLLMDWDPSGEALMQKAGVALSGLWEGNARFRERMRAMCRRDVKDVEGVPGLMRRLGAGGAGGLC